MLQFILPAVAIILISLPLVKVVQGKTTKRSAKMRLATHVCGFFGTVFAVIVFQMMTNTVYAETSAVSSMTGTIAQGMGFLGAALATGLSALGAGIAVAAAAPAAIGAISENEKNFGKSLIFVAMGEGVAIYGLLISILIINAL
ncbi:ATP synthase subunit C [Tannockella kyphosi]|uniref:ATP synthase subunit C n=1 Tax=Tannockella kyphosi TaxID=2899121 RepID=UPI002012750C|nr:ATP synthase subunit C [Tannockella kyphosi]